MASLLDIPALEPLARLCREFDIEFELFGGAVTRLLKRTRGNTEDFHSIDIFDLGRPYSDLDLSHSGPPQLNAELQQAILEAIPNAECFRWDIRSHSEWATYRTATYFNNRIPVRLMSLSTNSQLGLQDPLNGCGDIIQGHYRYERNPFYTRSPLYRQGRDLEVFSSLIYLQALSESALDMSTPAQQQSLQTVAEVMRAAQTEQTIIALQENSYLRSRFRYLLVTTHPLRRYDSGVAR